MRDHNVQRPVLLFTVAREDNGLQANQDLHGIASETLRRAGADFKVVVESNSGDQWFVVPEEYKVPVFEILDGSGVDTVIYLSFDRVAYLRTKGDLGSGEVLGQFTNLEDFGARAPDVNRHNGWSWIDACHNAEFAILNYKKAS